jgi:hypothetical protein
MFRYAKFTTLIAVTLGALTVGVQALENGNSPGANRTHRRQLVVAEATPFCVEAAGQDTLRIRGLNLGNQAPNVTLALVPLVVVSGPMAVAGDVSGLQETVTMLPDAFCDNPASDLLTVMRAKTRWARSRRDLAAFEVTIVGAGEIPADLVDQVLPADQTGAIDLRIFWSAGTNSGDIEWLISTVCLGDDDPITPMFNAQQTVVDAAGSLNDNLMIAGLGAVTQTGCAPGEVLVIDVARDADGPNDTLGIAAALHGLEVTINR